MKYSFATPYRLTFVWVALLAATALSRTLGQETALLVNHNTGTAIIAVAFAKIYFVMMEFMELRRAPILLRAAGVLWIVAIGLGIIVLYRL